MTRLNIQNLILYWLDDLQAGYFTPTQVNVWINNAQREVQKQLVDSGELYYEETLQTPLVVGQADYVFPSDFVKIHRMEIVLSGSGTTEVRQQLTPITLNQQNLVGNDSGTPLVYAVKKNRFTLFPTPDDDLTLRLYQSYRVVDMTADGDIPDVPEDYHEYIAILACLDGFIKDDRAPNTLIEKRDAYMARMRAAFQDRSVDQSRQVIVRDQGWGGSW